MVLTTIHVFIIWNDCIRLHTFQNVKRSRNVDRPTGCEMQIYLKIPGVPQKTGHYWILCNVKAIKAIMHSEMTNFDFDYAQVALT
jgi:NADPH-dependent ferric siderophore reductase